MTCHNLQPPALAAAVFVLCSPLAHGQNCAQYNTGSNPAKSFNLQICCSQSSFATSDPTCQQNSLNFVFFNNSQCGNSCAPPSSSDYIPSTGKVVPQTGWQPGATVNICVDPGFGTTDSQALANGAAAGLAAAGQKTTITYNLTASVCTGKNSYQIVGICLPRRKEDDNTGTRLQRQVERLSGLDRNDWIRGPRDLVS